eukprot:CAMPEP_0202687810 /NCGR_PEP_ID=MMETSP1385-20130828/3415_1 /ASSEMBLY_ACC=CAM_ASM_000861 /TAXON_ID=933848 /ORGANISM="Elphidium margaritaceum" /LENGTH=1136 /DNA_ID=CAMNT_0049342659 /DNA_START=17 /DNA_END=3427 /DNA_ORIENTATION=-
MMKRNKRSYDDFDQRGYGQSGGRGRGNYGNRRYHHHGHHGGGGGGGYRSGYRNAPPPQPEALVGEDREKERMERIKLLLVKIGDRGSSSSLATNLNQLSTALLTDIEHYRAFIISTLFECIAYLPIKAPIYATLVALINHVKPDFGKEVVDTLATELSIALHVEQNENRKHEADNATIDGNNSSNSNNKKQVGKSIIAEAANANRTSTDAPFVDLNRIRLLLRFAMCLCNANMVVLDDVLHIMQFLLQHCLHDAIDMFVREHVSYALISALIYGLNGDLLRNVKQSEERKQMFVGIMQTLGDYVENRVHVKNVSVLKPFKNLEIDFLTEVWRRLKCVVHKHATESENERPSQSKCESQNENTSSDIKPEPPQAGAESEQPPPSSQQAPPAQESSSSESQPPMIVSIHCPYQEFSRLKQKKATHSLSLMDDSSCMPDMSAWRNLSHFLGDQDGYLLLPLWLQFGVPNLLERARHTTPPQQQQPPQQVADDDDDAAVKSEQRSSSGDGDKNKDAQMLDEYVVMDYIHDIFLYFNQDTKLCAEQLINLPCSPTIESKYMVVDAIFFKMLSLPSSAHHFIFFGKVIIELFRKQTKVWPRVVGPIINKMFHQLSQIDIECRDRLVEWFAFHLDNFNFQWPWENWSTYCSQNAVSDPKVAFVRSVFLKCLHLSYYQRFKKTLPEDIMAVFPPKPDANYSKYAGNDCCSNLLRLLNQRQSAEDILNHLNKYIESRSISPVKPVAAAAAGDAVDSVDAVPELLELESLKRMLSEMCSTETQDIRVQQLEFLFVCILHVGKSSCSHALSVLKTYKKLLRQLTESLAYGELILLRVLFEYWSASPIRVEILIDKLHALNYVSPLSIIKFLFVAENMGHLYQQIFWTVLKQAIDRIVKTTKGMLRGIAMIQSDIAELDKNLNSDFGDHEATNVSKEQKLKQLHQLQSRLTQTQDKISNVFVSFFKSSMQSLCYMAQHMDDNLNGAGADEDSRNGDADSAAAAATVSETVTGSTDAAPPNDVEQKNKEDDEDEDDEMDDDMLMSEQFVQKQYQMDQAKKNKKIAQSKINSLEGQKQNRRETNQYIFTVIAGRMVEITRKFYTHIDDKTWHTLQNEVFTVESSSESDNVYVQQIAATLDSINEMRHYFQ